MLPMVDVRFYVKTNNFCPAGCGCRLRANSKHKKRTGEQKKRKKKTSVNISSNKRREFAKGEKEKRSPPLQQLKLSDF